MLVHGDLEVGQDLDKVLESIDRALARSTAARVLHHNREASSELLMLNHQLIDDCVERRLGLP